MGVVDGWWWLVIVGGSWRWSGKVNGSWCWLVRVGGGRQVLGELFTETSFALNLPCRMCALFVPTENSITLLPSVNTLIAQGMFCGAKCQKSFIDKNMRKSHWHQAVHIT